MYLILKSFSQTAYDTASEIVDIELPEAVQVRRKTLRKTLNLNKETKEVLSLIDEHSSQSNRTPVMQGYEELGDTYVAVSIEQQHNYPYQTYKAQPRNRSVGISYQTV